MKQHKMKQQKLMMNIQIILCVWANKFNLTETHFVTLNLP